MMVVWEDGESDQVVTSKGEMDREQWQSQSKADNRCRRLKNCDKREMGCSGGGQIPIEGLQGGRGQRKGTGQRNIQDKGVSRHDTHGLNHPAVGWKRE